MARSSEGPVSIAVLVGPSGSSAVRCGAIVTRAQPFLPMKAATSARLKTTIAE
jgi:hypothetical protein